MKTTNTSTVVDSTLQKELAEYGIFRKEVLENTSSTDPFFGLRVAYGGYETKFGVGIKAIQEANMDVAIVAPENEPFDMLITKDFNKAIKTASKDDLRSFLRSIVDRV